MLKKLIPALVANAILALLFVYFNYFIWAELNSGPNMLRLLNFGPFYIQDSHMGVLINGTQYSPVNGIVLMQNYPFLLFFVAIAVNLYFLFKLQRSNENKAKELASKI